MIYSQRNVRIQFYDEWHEEEDLNHGDPDEKALETFVIFAMRCRLLQLLSHKEGSIHRSQPDGWGMRQVHTWGYMHLGKEVTSLAVDSWSDLYGEMFWSGRGDTLQPTE